jgi:DNA-binding PadR family transcriptional regulator
MAYYGRLAMNGNTIRLTSTSYVVLGLIDYLGPSTSYDLKRSIERSVENFWPVPHTTFYAEPARLEAAGFLSARQEHGGRRRRLYAITEKGREALRDWVREEEAAPPQLRDELMLKVFLGADPAPLLRQRLEWHRTKLEELEGYLERVRDARGPAGVPTREDPMVKKLLAPKREGVERSLVAGTGYHRMLIEMLEEALGELEGEEPSERPGAFTAR